MSIEKTAIVSCCLVGAALVPLAAASPVTDAMSSQDVSFNCDYQDGSSLGVAYTTDGTFKADNGMEGAWSIKGDDVCLTIEGGDEGCATIPETAKLGEAFTMSDIFGQPVTCTVD